MIYSKEQWVLLVQAFHRDIVKEITREGLSGNLTEKEVLDRIHHIARTVRRMEAVGSFEGWNDLITRIGDTYGFGQELITRITRQVVTVDVA